MEARPGTFIQFEIVEPRAPLVDAPESLRRFNTVAFGIETMRGYIRIAYQVVPLIDTTAEKYLGRKLTDELLRQFVDDLNREIGSELRPIAPSATEGDAGLS